MESAVLSLWLLFRTCPGPAFQNCPPIGTARTQKARALNCLKNRTLAPTHAPEISLFELLAAGRANLDQGNGAITTGYVADVRPGGRESANCGRSDRQDLRLALVPEARLAPDKRFWVIVEIPPRWQEKLNLGQSDAKKLVGQWIVVSGWLFFDAPHARDRRNRGTAWELHPVTALSKRD